MSGQRINLTFDSESQKAAWQSAADADERTLPDYIKRVLDIISEENIGIRELKDLLNIVSSSGMSISELERLTGKQHKKHD